jgi:hypothetical protein
MLSYRQTNNLKELDLFRKFGKIIFGIEEKIIKNEDEIHEKYLNLFKCLLRMF